jgi:hypothetical protein
MPRDLEEEKEKVQLTQSPDNLSDTSGNEGVFSAFPREFVIIHEDQLPQRGVGGSNLHPYVRPLTISDVEAAVVVENVAFTNPEERATREKVCAYLLAWTHT